MFSGLFFKKRRLIKRLWNMRRSFVCPDENADEILTIVRRLLLDSSQGWNNGGGHSAPNVAAAKHLFVQVLNQFCVEHLQILIGELQAEKGIASDCLLINVDGILNGSKIFVNQGESSTTSDNNDDDQCSAARSFNTLKELMFYLLVADLKLMKRTNNANPFVRAPTAKPGEGDCNEPVFFTLPWCSSRGRSSDDQLVCLNPFHYAISHPTNSQMPEAGYSSVKGEVPFLAESSNNFNSSDQNRQASDLNHGVVPVICYLTYWEQSRKLGSTVNVEKPLLFCYGKSRASSNKTVPPTRPENVSARPVYFGCPLSNCDRQYCNLSALSQLNTPAATKNNNGPHGGGGSSPPPPPSSRQQRIGRGFALYVLEYPLLASGAAGSSVTSRHRCVTTTRKCNEQNAPQGLARWPEGSLVILHNQGPSVLYVKSNFLSANLEKCCRKFARSADDPALDQPIQLMPGYALIVQRIGFTKKDAASHVKKNVEHLVDYDTASVLISFSKCWGRSYKRTLITYCPCWTELVFPIR